MGDRRGASALAQLSRYGMVTLVLTSGEAGETWAVVAAKGSKAQKIGLKEQAKRLGGAYPMARRRRLRWELLDAADAGGLGVSLLLVKRPGAVQITALALG